MNSICRRRAKEITIARSAVRLQSVTGDLSWLASIQYSMSYINHNNTSLGHYTLEQQQPAKLGDYIVKCLEGISSF